jgi:hypothetical protein
MTTEPALFWAIRRIDYNISMKFSMRHLIIAVTLAAAGIGCIGIGLRNRNAFLLFIAPPLLVGVGLSFLFSND